MEQNKLENQEVKINANNYINKFTQSQMIISKQNAQINELGTKFINLESELLKNQMEFRLIKESENFKDAYIEHMEKEITTFNIKLKKLSKNHPALNFFQKDPIQTIEEISDRVKTKFAKLSREVVANILG